MTIIADDQLTDEQLAELKPVCLGPTWKTGPDDSWLLPERTLGWQIAGWCSKWLRNDKGGPWKFTREQLRFILWWYAIDEDGRFLYRTGVLQRMKGWGKDPLVAVMCMVELCGPSRFGGYDEDGKPFGVPHPSAWVQVAAVSRDQTRNTMTVFPSLMSDEFKRQYKIRDGAELIRANDGRQRLEAVTSSYRALEGGRSTFIVLNETHHWVRGNNGDKMYETIDGNATKMDGRYLAITNAYLPGEDSVAEKMRDSFEKIREGRAPDIGFMYDSLEAHPKTPLTVQALRYALSLVIGDSVWLRPATIIQSILNTTIGPSRSRRMWLNQIVADEEALFGPADWTDLEDIDAELMPGEAIVMGFDGGKSDDATCLVAIRVSDSCVFPLGLWEKPEGPDGKRRKTEGGYETWQVPRDSVDNAVHSAFRVYDVKGFYADVALWESYISEWAGAYGEGLEVKAEGRDAISWDMRQSLQRVTRANERLMQTILDKRISHNCDLALQRHVLNARRRENNYGVSFGKESADSPRKVDLYAAMLLAHECLHALRTRGKKQKKKTGRGYFL